jgi:hypothetical protein
MVDDMFLLDFGVDAELFGGAGGIAKLSADAVDIEDIDIAGTLLTPSEENAAIDSADSAGGRFPVGSEAVSVCLAS